MAPKRIWQLDQEKWNEEGISFRRTLVLAVTHRPRANLFEPVTERTPHGEERHADANRPTSEAAADKATAKEIYRDVESGYYVFIGARGRTHVFTVEGAHHTSFRTTQANRQKRETEGKWERVGREELPDEVK